MATDATGAPTTTLGIPKYNTAGDPPSGKGFNAAMDYIDDLIEARGGPPGASGVKVWNNTTKTWDTPAGGDGTKFLRDDGTFAPVNAGPGDPVTALPGSPVDKQQALLVDSLTAPTYAWLLQYEAGISDTNKWILLGGSPLTHYVDTAESTSSTSYVDLTTTGPTITVPRAGIYEIHFGCDITAAAVTTAYVTVKLGAAAAADTDNFVNVIAGAGYENTGSRTIRRTLAAGDALKLMYKMSTATSGTFSKRYIRAVPVRVA